MLEEALDTAATRDRGIRAHGAGRFLFRGDDVFKKVAVLSGGEKSRLALVKLLLDPPNLLLMDEPTTHLDMSSIDALIWRRCDQFTGTLIFISHDVYFIRQLSNHVVRVEAGRLTHFPGGYQYYLDKTAAASPPAGRRGHNAAAARGRSEPGRKEQKRIEAEQRQARSGERKARQERVAKLEAEILRLETRQKELAAELENPATYEKPGHAMVLNREWMEVAGHLKSLGKQWEEAADKLGEIKQA